MPRGSCFIEVGKDHEQGTEAYISQRIITLVQRIFNNSTIHKTLTKENFVESVEGCSAKPIYMPIVLTYVGQEPMQLAKGIPATWNDILIKLLPIFGEHLVRMSSRLAFKLVKVRIRAITF